MDEKTIEEEVEENILEILRQNGPMYPTAIFEILSPKVAYELLNVILEDLGARGKTVYCRAGYKLANGN